MLETRVFLYKKSGRPLGVANGNYETLRDRETSVFLFEPETFDFLVWGD